MAVSPSIIDRLGRGTIRQALKGETAERRANAVQKIGRDIRDASLSEPDLAFATTLMDRICKDVSDLVRRALAVTLRSSPHLPPHLARQLIADIDSIAVPILSSSPVLTDADLRSVLKSKAAEKVRAIAQRKTLSLHISHAIVSFGDSAATARLAANDGALISPETAELIGTLHSDNDLIREAVLSREDFPPQVIAKLIDQSAAKVDANLKTYPGMSDQRAGLVSRDMAERARSYVIGESWPQDRLRDYARSLDRAGKLTPRLVLRAAGRGDMRFVLTAMSLLAQQTLEKTSVLVLAGNGIGAKAAAIRARFDVGQVALFTACVDVWLAVERENTALSRAQFQRKIAERLISLELDLTDEMESDLLDLLDSNAGLRLVA
ncbi:DUF2336 domain-containing protein [Litorimonas sp. WD9-15]|uniref:DUF2336 domain-containing protein n=1 Tax=Litorimonas sp. WD9-15 TaxID=3418716 RepID=UPI003CFC8193